MSLPGVGAAGAALHGATMAGYERRHRERREQSPHLPNVPEARWAFIGSSFASDMSTGVFGSAKRTGMMPAITVADVATHGVRQSRAAEVRADVTCDLRLGVAT